MCDMKPKVGKTIRNALILSIVFHIVLACFLRTPSQRELSSLTDLTYLEITKTHTQRALRVLKRERYIPPKYTPIQQKQVEVVVTPPDTSLPTAAPITHRNPVTPDRSFTLITPHTLGNHNSNGNSTLSMVNQNSVSIPKSGSFNLHGIVNSTKQPSFKPLINHLVPTVSDLPLPNVILERIGHHIISNRNSNLVDIVFVIDGSGSMKDNINAVQSHLKRMTKLFDDAELDFTLGIIIFRDQTGYNMFGWDFEVIPQTRSVSQIQRALAQVKCKGGEKALDALIRSVDEVKLRQHTDVHFILITDEYVSGNYSVSDVLTKMNDAKIKVDVIGLEEPFNKIITRNTGGIWLPISSLGAQ